MRDVADAASTRLQVAECTAAGGCLVVAGATADQLNVTGPVCTVFLLPIPVPSVQAIDTVETEVPVAADGAGTIQEAVASGPAVVFWKESAVTTCQVSDAAVSGPPFVLLRTCATY